MPVTRDELGKRIRSARERCGLTQEQLGDAVDLSRIAVSQIEAGHRSVSSIELDRIAYAVGCEIKAFFADQFTEQDTLAALFRADPQLARHADLLHTLQHCLALRREMGNLERLLGIDRSPLRTVTYETPAVQAKWDAIQQGERIAIQERQRLGLGISPVGDLIELFEAQGVRTGLVMLPDNISGLTLLKAKTGIFIIINQTHSRLRRRFSLAHEYAHVLIDRDRASAISRSDNKTDHAEVRANAFAAEFMMPAEGVIQFMQALGKGRASRAQMSVFNEAEVVQVEQRATPGSQDIQIHDVALIAHHFKVSRSTALYRLKNLNMIDRREFQSLKSQEDSGAGQAIANFLAVNEIEDKDEMPNELRSHFLGLALEANRREAITLSKLTELAAMVGVDRQEAHRLLASAGFERQ